MSDQPQSALDDPILRVPLVGPQLGETGIKAAPSVDGMAVFFVDPRNLVPYLVFVNDGLHELLGRGPDDLLGESALKLYTDDAAELEWAEIRAALLAGHVYADPEYAPGVGMVDQKIDIGAALDPEVLAGIPTARISTTPVPRTGANDTHTSFIHLVRADRSLVSVHATYSVVPSAQPGAPYLIAQFRDTSKQATERLLADKATIISSLDRGHELGRLCHQICAQVEEALGANVRCALGLTGPSGTLETVVSAGMSVDVVDQVLASMVESGKQAIGRVLKVDNLPDPLASRYRAGGFASVWMLPMLSLGSTLQGALVVASPSPGPDPNASRIIDHHINLLVAAIEHSRAESAMAHHALHDSLTHLPNRALIVDRLGQALARLERDGVALSVLLVDIDRFRSVNDSRGADVGDQVLVEVANRLLAAVRIGDTVGRVSSDQYLVLCVATNGEIDASDVAKRILRLVSRPIDVDGGEPIRVTASIGAVVIEEAGHSPSTVIGQAETALASATDGGRGQFAMYEPRHRQNMVDRHELEQDLHRAIREDELVVHYQPIIELRSGFMTGAEALIRWERPGHGLISPGAFIPVAEECELVVPMGEWVINQVCADLAAWPKSRGRSPMVSINLSARHLELDTLVPSVISALQRHGLQPQRLGFEITESMQISNLAAATVSLRRLAQLGCRVAIDDFGIGHATLDYLRRFSMAHVLKIDRSFVAGLGRSKEDTAIVSASIALAKVLELQVIAEGVEEEHQLARLRAMGCRYAQGYLFARSVPFARVLELWDQAQLVAAELPGSTMMGSEEVGRPPLPERRSGRPEIRGSELVEPPAAPTPRVRESSLDLSDRPGRSGGQVPIQRRPPNAPARQT